MEPAKTLSFLDSMPKKKRQDFEHRVRGLIEEAYKTAANKLFADPHWRASEGPNGTLSLSPHNPDWCQAFGLVQGVALMLGYDMWDETHEGTPRHWFSNLCREISSKYYKEIMEATERGDFEPTCTCGKKLIVSMQCPVCDRDE